MSSAPATLETQVLVVGAGPVGLSAACELARRGVKVMVIERDAGPIDQSRAIWVHPRTLELWEPLGIADAATRRGVLVDRIEIHVGSTRRATVWYRGEGRTSYPNGLMLEQSVTQRLLLDGLAELDAVPRWRTELVAFTQDDDGVTATAEAAGGPVLVRAQWLIGSDGASSTVRRQLGLDLEGGTYDEAFFLADLVGSTPLAPDRAHLTFSGVRTVAWLPLAGEGRWRVIGNLVETENLGSQPGYGRNLSQPEVTELVEATGTEVEVHGVDWATTYRSHHRIVPRYRGGRAFLAGDAAHLHSPAGGLGMNTGVADAVNLAWKLADVTQDRAPAPLLDTYEAERRPVAQRVLSTSDRLFVLQANTHPLFGLIRRQVLPRVARLLSRSDAGRSLAFRYLSGIEISYRDRGTAAGSRKGVLWPTKPGDRLPWVQLRDGSSSHELVRGGDHVLLVTARHPYIGDLEAAARSLAAGLAPPTSVVSRVDEPALVDALLGWSAGRGVAWVRPDRHLGWVGVDLHQLEGHLTRWMLTARPESNPPTSQLGDT